MKKLILTTCMLVIFHLSALADGDEVLVIIKDYEFIPEQVIIIEGQTVRWENQEKRQYHSVWFQALGEDEPEDYLFPDDSYERTFDTSGNFPYRCGPHPEMLGSVIVTE